MTSQHHQEGSSMTAPLIFLDTETTGLALADDIWEFAAIRREQDGTENELHLFIEHDPAKCHQLPQRFFADHAARWDPQKAVEREKAAEQIALFVSRRDGEPRPHIVGAVPNFDTERLALLLDEWECIPGWHHHLIDIEALAVGFLAAKGQRVETPWNSNDLSRLVGVEPPTTGRHTAMGDARWARDVYDRIADGGHAA